MILRFTYNKVVKAEEDPLLDGNTVAYGKKDMSLLDGMIILNLKESNYRDSNNSWWLLQLYAKWDEVVLPSIVKINLATGTATEFVESLQE